jgi:hypothetical protein
MVQMPCLQVFVVGALGAAQVRGVLPAVAIVPQEVVKRKISKTHRAVAITQAPT